MSMAAIDVPARENDGASQASDAVVAPAAIPNTTKTIDNQVDRPTRPTPSVTMESSHNEPAVQFGLSPIG
jgi:hypothetical protein